MGQGEQEKFDNRNFSLKTDFLPMDSILTSKLGFWKVFYENV